MSDPEVFLRELDEMVAIALSRIGEKSAAGQPAAEMSVANLLMLALKNELEASEEAAFWMVSEKDVEVKLALARQCGDEAKHYRLIEERLRGLGVDPSRIDPLAQGYTPMFEFLKGLGTTVERIAAGQFAREALAKVRNDVFADYCVQKGDPETAKLYREVIGPDEEHHHALGRKLLRRFAVTPEAQDLARKAATRTLELAEELQEMARMKKGISRAPGC
jgi:hypothetical protein